MKIKKYWPIIIALLCVVATMIFAQGCVTKAACPAQDVYIGARTPFGVIPLRIPKGHFDNPENYYTGDEYEKFMRDRPGAAPESERPPPSSDKEV